MSGKLVLPRDVDPYLSCADPLYLVNADPDPVPDPGRIHGSIFGSTDLNECGSTSLVLPEVIVMKMSIMIYFIYLLTLRLQ